MSKQIIEQRHSIFSNKSEEKEALALVAKAANLFTKLEGNLIVLKEALYGAAIISGDNVEFQLTDKIVKKCESLNDKIDDNINQLFDLGFLVFGDGGMNESYYKRRMVYLHIGAFLDSTRTVYELHAENKVRPSDAPTDFPLTEWVSELLLDQDISCISEIRDNCVEIAQSHKNLMSELKKHTHEYIDKENAHGYDKDDREITVYTLNTKSVKSIQRVTDAFFNNWDAMESYGFDLTHPEEHFDTYSALDQVPLFAKFVLKEYEENNNSKGKSSRASR